MAKWTLSTIQKKNIKEVSYWSKDGRIIARIEWYRWGTWTTESAVQPAVDTDNPDGYDVYGSDVNWDLVEMNDGDAQEWEWPGDMDEDEQNRLESLYEDDGYSGLEEDGWSNDETEIFLYGPLELSKETI